MNEISDEILEQENYDLERSKEFFNEIKEYMIKILKNMNNENDEIKKDSFNKLVKMCKKSPGCFSMMIYIGANYPGNNGDNIRRDIWKVLKELYRVIDSDGFPLEENEEKI